MMNTPHMAIQKAVHAIPASATSLVSPRPAILPVRTKTPLIKAPGKVAPVASGGMPRKLFVNPRAAVPPKLRAPGMNTLAIMQRRFADTGGRLLGRGTR